MKKRSTPYFLLILFLFACQLNKNNTPVSERAKSGTENNVTYQNPVLPGDYADPSVVRVGEDYWATATSSEWAPLFPVLHSKNLVDWETVGHIFPDKLPGWADAHFWAPEITYEKGKYYIYYTAQKKGGNLCVGVASATKATGPYNDHGPLVCQEVGSIDGFPMRDENGDLYLIWKEDANSVRKPTPLWGQRLNEARTALEGEKFELFRNDPKTWEGGLVEGPALVKRNGYFYLFYAGDACCGRGCTYGVGVARAKSLKGPWEKNPANPIMQKNDEWKCPGHGSLVTDKSHNDFFMYHAYQTKSFVYPGRQGLLDPVVWENNWPTFKTKSPGITAMAPHKKNAPDVLDIKDDFTQPKLNNFWQWSVTQIPQFSLSGANKGQLFLQAAPQAIGSFLGQRTKTVNYSATTSLPVKSVGVGVTASLAAIGDLENALGIGVKNGELIVWQTKRKVHTILSTTALPSANQIYLKVQTSTGDKLNFSWSADGKSWVEASNGTGLDASFLPPWDRGVRIGLVAKGDASQKVVFDSFTLTHQ